MSAEYKATPELLDQISNFAIENFYTDIDQQKFINSIIRSSTGLWDPRFDSDVDDTVYTADYTHYKYNTADNKRRLDTHLADSFARSKLEEYNWLIDNSVASIDYKINNSGFRCENFNNDAGIIFVGCSHTYGTGMPVEDIWPSLVADRFNMQSWNLGTPGLSSTPGTFYLLNWHTSIPNPKAIVLFDPPLGRIELYKQHSDFYSINILKTLLVDYGNDASALANRLYHSLVATSEVNYKLNQISLRLLAEKLNIPFVYGSFNGLNNVVDFARDLMHPGRKTHNLIAKHFIAQLEKVGLV